MDGLLRLDVCLCIDSRYANVELPLGPQLSIREGVRGAEARYRFKSRRICYFVSAQRKYPELA